MTDRQNTIVCAFDLNSPRITAHHIHDWIYESLKLPETDVRMIQIDGPRRRVYIKFNNSDRALSVLQETAGRGEFRHDTGELSIVHIDWAGMGVRRIRLANLPPEVPDRIIRGALSPYGEVTEVHADTWSKAYRYPVYNGIRIAVTKLKKHLPSHMIIANTRVLISYEGQPPTCYGCNEQGHQSQVCPRRKQPDTRQEETQNTSWADVVTQGTRRPPLDFRRSTDPPSCSTHEEDKAEPMNTPQPNPETSMASARTEDEDAEMETQTQDRYDHKQQTCGGTQPTSKKTNDNTLEQNTEARNTMAPADASQQDTYHVDIARRMEQPVNDRGKGDPTAYSGGRQDDLSPQVGGSMMSEGTTSPKRTKKLRTERDVSLTRERTRSKTRATKPHSDEFSI